MRDTDTKPDAAGPNGGRFSRAAPLVLAIALFMEQMDSTIIATALPAIAADVGATPISLKLALTAYLVALAIFIPISSWMAERYGANNVFRVAIGVFMVGSLACALSSSLTAFVLSRFLQGMGGAMMTPVARVVLVRSTPRGELMQALTWLTMPALVGPLVGPPVGGFITTYFSWHWIFLINIPIGAVGIFMAGRVLPRLDPQPGRRLDVAGFTLAAVAAAGIVFGLSVVSLPALPPVAGAATVGVGILAAILYVRHARRTPAPILDLSLFSNAAFRASVIGGSLFRIGAGASPFLLPLMFQLGFGLTPFQSGMLTFVSAGGALVLKFGATTALRLAGFRNLLIVSGLAGAALLALCGLFRPDTPWQLIVAVLFASGFMRSMFFTSANALVFADLPDSQAAQASALASAFQQISIAMGVAVAGGVLEVVGALTGEPLGLGSFSWAFYIVGGLTALAALAFVRLDPDTGHSVSGKAPVSRSSSPIEPS